MIISAFVLHAVVFIFLGMIIGFLAGLFGIGGGLLLVPALLYLFTTLHLVPQQDAMQMAAATSLAVMIFTASSAVLTHVRRGQISWLLYKRLLPGMAVGAILGAALTQVTPTDYLKKFLGFMLLGVFVHWVFQWHHQPSKSMEKKHHWSTYPVGLAIGMFSGLVGIGGGALIVPYLTYLGVDTRKISAISNACTLAVGIIGTIAFAILGWHHDALPPYALGYIYTPIVAWIALPSMLLAPLGAKLTYILPVQPLKYGFAILILAISIRLIL